MNSLVTVEGIQKRILLLRGQKVMLSMDLAELYDVEVRALVQAVKRNRERFPDDFMFQLNKTEFAHLKSQIVTSSWGGLRRAAPYAFTEQGVAMLSSVLRSRRAIQVNITIMRTFVQLRELAATHKELAAKLAELERKVAGHDGHIRSLFEAIRQLMNPPASRGRRIGFEMKPQGTGKPKGHHR
ncbi:MAG TPA: ORF6N domain-containing protein [Nitrospira sp.]|nr:ORF6N domain-containing protein [Nitrospira sp.]